MQNLHPASTSAPQAGQFSTCKFCPQCGQNLASRPAGNSPLQYRQRESANAPAPTAALPPETRSMVSDVGVAPVAGVAGIARPGVETRGASGTLACAELFTEMCDSANSRTRAVSGVD